MTTRLNFIPETLQVTTARRRRLVQWGIAVACASLAVAVPLTLDWLQRAAIGRLRERNTQLQAELEATRIGLRATTSEVSQVRLQLQRADAIRNKRAWSGILAMFADNMPAGCWLTSLATDPPSGPNTAAVAAPAQPTNTAQKPGEQAAVASVEVPRRLRLSGYAADASLPHVFVKSLKETSVFARVNLQKAVREATGDGQYFRFDVECEW